MKKYLISLSLVLSVTSLASENGLVEAKSHKSSRTGATGAGTPAGAEAPGGAGAEAGAEAGSAQVLINPLKTIKEETIKREINTEEAL